MLVWLLSDPDLDGLVRSNIEHMTMMAMTALSGITKHTTAVSAVLRNTRSFSVSRWNVTDGHRARGRMNAMQGPLDSRTGLHVQW